MRDVILTKDSINSSFVSNFFGVDETIDVDLPWSGRAPWGDGAAVKMEAVARSASNAADSRNGLGVKRL